MRGGKEGKQKVGEKIPGEDDNLSRMTGLWRSGKKHRIILTQCNNNLSYHWSILYLLYLPGLYTRLSSISQGSWNAWRGAVPRITGCCQGGGGRSWGCWGSRRLIEETIIHMRADSTVLFVRGQGLETNYVKPKHNCVFDRKLQGIINLLVKFCRLIMLGLT